MKNKRQKTTLKPHELYLDRVIGGVTLLALHEAGSLRGHAAAAHERLLIARRARGIGELLRDQIDLLPESRNRFSRDHQVRRELWRGLIRDLSTTAMKTAA
jgi:hypothetical protein